MDTKALAEAFCAWPLPTSVCPDPCATDRAYAYSRSGTNLLTVAEAKAMFDHLVEMGLLPRLATPAEGAAGLADAVRTLMVNLRGQLAKGFSDDDEIYVGVGDLRALNAALSTSTDGGAAAGVNDGLDIDGLSALHAQIPAGPYQAMRCGDGLSSHHEVRAFDTRPDDKHHWPYRLLASIPGQIAGCDGAVFDFVAGVVNAWPQIAARLAPPADRAAGPSTGEA